MENALNATQTHFFERNLQKIVPSLQRVACDLVYRAQQVAITNVRSLAKDMSIAHVQPKSTKKHKNSATLIFEKTGGKHNALLEHEEEEMRRKEEEKKVKELKKQEREARKRKAEEVKQTLVIQEPKAK